MSFLSRVLNHHSDRQSGSPTSLKSSAHKRHSSLRFALHIKLESPPIVLYGHPNESTGSIISGVLKLEILPPKTPAANLEPISSRSSASHLTPVSSATSLESALGSDVEMDSVVLLLVQTMHYSKPFLVQSAQIAGCDKCLTRVNTLARWDALLERSPFPVGSHAYPFSHLIPGLLAPTSKLGGRESQSYIKYELIAVATSGSKETKLVFPVNILRSIPRGPDRNSQRIFPPTEVTASAVLPSVIYPMSSFPIELRMDNVVNNKQDRRWRMRKLSWKLEEHTQVRAHACQAHEAKLQIIEDAQRKAQLHKDYKLSQPDPSSSGARHHLTIQTGMVFGAPPASSAPTRAEMAAATTDGPSSPANRDIVQEEEEGIPNRPADEANHFDEDFGSTPETLTTGPATLTAGPESPGPTVSIRANSSNDPSTWPADASPGVDGSDSNPGTNGELFLTELRAVAHGDLKSGWKSDFSDRGRIELVADVVALHCSPGLRPHMSSKSSTDAHQDDTLEMLNDATISYDIEDPELGIYVSHVLVVEIIVAEEISQPPPKTSRGDGLTPVTSVSSISSNPGVGIPTGSARVLRMQFKLNVTERSGLGIAWDDEVPPTYEDVRALSPPTYDSLAASTPHSSAANLNDIGRRTPAVLYGVGDTPLVGSFANRQYQNIDSLADLEDGINELRI